MADTLSIAPPLTDAEREIVEFWVQVGTLFGFPSSIGQIYGFLFVREQAQSADDLVEALAISRSSAGQGLRALNEVGAIRRQLSVGTRREHYQIEPDLGVLFHNIMARRIFPSLVDLEARLKRIEAQSSAEENGHVKERLEKLRRWAAKSQPIIKQLRDLA